MEPTMVISLPIRLRKSTGTGSLCRAMTPSVAPLLAAASAVLITVGTPAASR